MRQDGFDHLVNRIACFDHEHDAARALQQRGELFNGVRAHDVGALRLNGQKVVDLRDRAVEKGNLKAVVVQVEDEILSHDSESDEADIASWVGHTISKKSGWNAAFCVRS